MQFSRSGSRVRFTASKVTITDAGARAIACPTNKTAATDAAISTFTASTAKAILLARELAKPYLATTASATAAAASSPAPASIAQRQFSSSSLTNWQLPAGTTNIGSWIISDVFISWVPLIQL